jgi:hypothetical protein
MAHSVIVDQIRIALRSKKLLGWIDPADAEDKFEFMQECIDELGDEEACLLIWEEQQE